ncbi:uncharacterized protein LOC144135194 [Amblyomma americanum]
MKLTGFTALILSYITLPCVLSQVVTSPQACDFSGLDLDSMVNEVVSHLPVDYAEHESWPEAYIGGLVSSSIIFSGLNKLRPYGPPLSYCNNGSRLVQFDLATPKDEQIKAWARWKTCSSQNGTFGTLAGARVTATFEVVNPRFGRPGVSGPVLIYNSGPTIVSVNKASFYLDGAGDVMATVAAVLGKLFPQILNEFWDDALTSKLGNILDIVTFA